nr:hypothetical protein CFP56_44331 [Quercus suber]
MAEHYLPYRDDTARWLSSSVLVGSQGRRSGANYGQGIDQQCFRKRARHCWSWKDVAHAIAPLTASPGARAADVRLGMHLASTRSRNAIRQYLIVKSSFKTTQSHVLSCFLRGSLS